MKMFGPRSGTVRAAWLCLFGLASLRVLLPGAPVRPTDETPRARIQELRAEIARHDDLYFKQAKPEITDAEYDRLKRELTGLEAEHPAPVETNRTPGDDRSGRFPTYRHRTPMLSLEKAYTEAEWRAFHAKLVKQLAQPEPLFVIEPKYDGVAISLTYERGILVRAVTRGNGSEGDDVTANVRTIRGLPAVLQTAVRPAPARLELRGEIYLGHAEFARINAEREAEGVEPFAHPRNVAAGTLKSSDPAEAAQRRLSIVIHGWGAWEGGEPPSSQQAFLVMVRAWGLPAVDELHAARGAEEVWTAVRALERKRSALAFPIDGAVVKLDEVAARGMVGMGKLAPRWAIACKHEARHAVTRLRAITWQVGRTGVLTPVAEFDPVELGGSAVARASVHNRDEIARRDLRIGDFIEVEKAGEIIPMITGVLHSRRIGNTTPISVPADCPACGTKLVAPSGGAAVRCPGIRCPAQRQRRLEHFASAQAVDLGGFGPATIAALSAAGLVETPADFYRLRREDLEYGAEVGAKTAERLLAAIERSRTTELWRFIYGLGIPQVGAARAKHLALRCGGLEGLARMEEGDLAGIIGPAAAASVEEFMARPSSQAEIQALIAAGVKPASVTATARPLNGKVFVFTGTLPGLPRARAEQIVSAAGGLVRESVSRQTDYVVAGVGAGSKLADANRLGVRVIGFEEFRRLADGE